MFSGIVGAEGRVASVVPEGSGRRFRIQCDGSFLEGVQAGASIAVNGACQTVEAFDLEGFCFFSSRETLERTTLGGLAAGALLNLERALTLASPLDGHLVTGHVDAVARVVRLEDRRESWLLEVTLPGVIRRLVAEKGSLAVNGVSLTVNRVGADSVQMMVIPFTFEHTTLRRLATGDPVNLEADIIARYAVRYLQTSGGDEAGGLGRLLEENGFT